MQKLSQFVWLPGKAINVIESFSCQLYEIIINNLFKVNCNFKTMFGRDVNKFSFSDKAFQIYSFD